MGTVGRGAQGDGWKGGRVDVMVCGADEVRGGREGRPGHGRSGVAGVLPSRWPASRRSKRQQHRVSSAARVTVSRQHPTSGLPVCNIASLLQRTCSKGTCRAYIRTQHQLPQHLYLLLNHCLWSRRASLQVRKLSIRRCRAGVCRLSCRPPRPMATAACCRSGRSPRPA